MDSTGKEEIFQDFKDKGNMAPKVRVCLTTYWSTYDRAFLHCSSLNF